jgi:ribosomal protein S15P/S13E
MLLDLTFYFITYTSKIQEILCKLNVHFKQTEKNHEEIVKVTKRLNSMTQHLKSMTKQLKSTI